MPTPQTFDFSGQSAVVGTSGTGVDACAFSGSSNGGETVAVGVGTGSGSCSGSGGTIDASFSYAREGGAVLITGTVTGSITGNITCELGFAATSTPPVTTYRMAGPCAHT